MPTRPELYISVDVEASGPIPGEYSLLSLGACVVGDPSRRFYVEFIPLNDNSVPEAMLACDLSLAELRARGTEPRAAMSRFAAWLESVSDGARPVMAGFNAPFDWSFVNYYFHKFLGDNPLGHAALDIKSYYMGAYHTTWSETSMSRLPNWLDNPDTPHTHNALDDAVQQADIFSRLLTTVPARRDPA